MKVHVVSDLHLEFGEAYQPPDCDLIVLAGDIDTGIRGISWAGSLGIPAIYVAGNHEFYKAKGFSKVYTKMEREASRCGVNFLQNSVVILEGVAFLGATFWTDYMLNNTQQDSMRYAQNRMSDYRVIRDDSTYRAITPQKLFHEHCDSLHFLASNIQYFAPRMKTVVITHHAPTKRSIDLNPMHDRRLDPCYASDTEEFLIRKMNPDIWIHGHIHCAQDYWIGDTRLICNPRGYPREKVENFDNSLILEV